MKKIPLIYFMHTICQPVLILFKFFFPILESHLYLKALSSATSKTHVIADFYSVNLSSLLISCVEKETSHSKKNLLSSQQTVSKRRTLPRKYILTFFCYTTRH